MGLAKRKKTTRAAPRRGAKLESPKWDNWEKLSGAEFHRKSQAAREFYYQNYKPADLYPYTWMEKAVIQEDIRSVKAHRL